MAHLAARDCPVSLPNTLAYSLAYSLACSLAYPLSDAIFVHDFA
jgi:hypothetical protein